MHKETLEHMMNKYFSNNDDVAFALIFGSYVSGKLGAQSDLDVGVFTKRELDLLSLGRMVSDLEEMSGMKIDIVELNDIYKKNPLLAYNIATNNKPVYVENIDDFIAFKRNSLLYYFDTKQLRKSVNSAFMKRISNKNFGKRNYA